MLFIYLHFFIYSISHTERGRERDPFHRRDTQDYDNCFLHDVDVTRLPTQNIIPDPDHDLFEMGRLMGAECVLYDQYVNRRPGDESRYESRYPGSTSSTWTSSTHDYNYRPTSSTFNDRYDRDRERGEIKFIKLNIKLPKD